MSQEQSDEESEDRTVLPIERGFPIERVNEIAEKESRAKQWYRPIYTMHKWWARRPGCLFRAISLYALLNDGMDAGDFEVYEPGQNQTLGSTGSSREDLAEKISEVDMEDPESLWEFYPKDVRVSDKKVLDPFMGGGTSLVEASRFGADTVGVDLNPVAWFVTKKELEAGQTSVEELERAFERVRDDVADEITQYYETPCPNASPDASSDEDPADDQRRYAGHDGGNGGAHDADVMYNFWVKELDCVSCGHTVPLFKDYRVAEGRYENDDKYNCLCPDCGAVTLVEDWREASECDECSHEWVPEEGNVSRGGYYNCPECGQKESITDAIADQGEPDMRLYAVEYYCEECDRQGRDNSACKGYKRAETADKRLFEEAKRTWRTRTDLHEYVPDEEIPEGAITAASEVSGNDVFQHGFEEWKELFNERQLLCFAQLLQAIEGVKDRNLQDYLLLAATECLRTNSMIAGYQPSNGHISDLWRNNSFDPATAPAENNLWGTKYGMITFRKTFDKIKSGIEYANSPTDRYVEDGETIETKAFAQPIGLNSEVRQGDMRNLTAEDEFDAVITDPPYYDNIIYSEVADFLYVWQKILLEDVYPGFDRDHTPRTESIVTNPYLDKTADDFEHEMGQALEVINRALTDDGVLAFTYHHSDEESWGELLQSLCETGFEVTATYPINSDLHKFIGGDSVSFDIVIVARPTDDRTPISWRRLKIDIINRLDGLQSALAEREDLKRGDMGVIEMGACFAEYSKHHGEVRRSGEILTAKEAVEEIYGILQDDALGEAGVYLDLRREGSPTYDDVNKLLRQSDASEAQMKTMNLFRKEDEGEDFELYDWRDEQRQAYVQATIEAGDGDATVLDRAHFLRYRYEHGKSTAEYLDRWDTDELQELCEGLAEATDDATYLKMLGADESLAAFGDE
ncbi:DUF1156 domain-containing protein [Halorussus lipolyticus]|uniref:DUF1156 domain-containing protein n=1 Tax=Halorussus lipolyticus TaxID=3034024 RepID=UPI0023E888C6|nr:DUF1156 domain-containing protein [Halorussus sp. DT80]